MFPFEKVIELLQGVLPNFYEVTEFSEWIFVFEVLQSIAVPLDSDFLSARLYGYLFVFQKTQGCNCFLCACM